jgi:hypothetical protein
MKIRSAWTCLFFSMAIATQTPARASCALPYTLTNGQTADANQVMANLNAIIGCLGSATGGFVNKFRNGTMDVWQRGTSGTSTMASGPTTQTSADGWYIVPTGASVAWAQVPGRGPTLYSLKVTGATSVTDVTVKQRIESSVAAPLEGQIVTVQAEVYNSTGAAITPTLTVRHAGSVDNWSSPVTDVSAVSLQSAANSQWTQVAYTFQASAASSNGLEISFDFGNNFSSSSQLIQITELDVRSTPGVATGINNGPPLPELRPIGVELPFNQRYFETSYDAGVTPGTAGNLNTPSQLTSPTPNYPGIFVNFGARKRADPTIVLYSPHSGTIGDMSTNNTDYPALLNTGAEAGFGAYINSTSGPAVGVTFYSHWTASAEL